MILASLLPLLSPYLSYLPQVLISLAESFVLWIQSACAARGNDGTSLHTSYSFITSRIVVPSVCCHLFDWLINLLQQVWQNFLIRNIVGCCYLRNDLSCLGIYAKVEFAPGAAFRIAVNSYFPFTFPVDFQPCRVKQGVQRF